MTTLTIRMDPREKQKLMAWAAAKGTTTTGYIKDLVAADMAASLPEDRAAAWLQENATALQAESEALQQEGVPGSSLAMLHPWPDGEV